MAVRYLGVSGVDNPYRELQQSVNTVGQIFRDYDEEQRRRAESARNEFEYMQQLQERDRTNQQRTALAEYNPNIGKDYRGIDASLRPFVEAQENTLRTQWGEANPNATAEDRAAFEAELNTIRSSLASSEDVYSAVFNDVLRISQNPAYADTVAKAQAAQYRSRSAPIEQARANADAFNADRDREANLRLEMWKAESQNRRNYGNNVVKLVDDLYGGTGRSSGGSGKGGSYSPDKYNFKTDAEFREVLIDRIGGWRDAPNALKHATTGLDEYNRLAREAGKPELSAHHKYQAIIEDIVEGGMFHDNNVRYSSGEDFTELLIRKFGLPDSDRDVNTAAAQSHNRTAGLAEVENILSGVYRPLSKEEQLAILNPQRITVDVTKEQQRWVANAYYARWPELAKRSPVVMEQVTTAETASTPAGNRTAPSGQGNTRTGGPAPATEEAPAGNRTGPNILSGSPFVNFNNTASTQSTDTAPQADQVSAGSARLLEGYPEDVQALASTIFTSGQNNSRLPRPSSDDSSTISARNTAQVLANLRSTDPEKYAQVTDAVNALTEARHSRPALTDLEGPQAHLEQLNTRLGQLDELYGSPEGTDRLLALNPEALTLRNDLLDERRRVQEEIAQIRTDNRRKEEEFRLRQDALSRLPVNESVYRSILDDPRYGYNRPGTEPVRLPNRASVQQVAQSSPEVSEELNRMLQDMGVPVTLPGLLPPNTRRPRSIVLDPSQQQTLIRRLDNLQNTYSRPAGSGVAAPQ